MLLKTVQAQEMDYEAKRRRRNWSTTSSYKPPSDSDASIRRIKGRRRRPLIMKTSFGEVLRDAVDLLWRQVSKKSTLKDTRKDVLSKLIDKAES